MLDGIALRMLGVPLVLAMVIIAFVTNYIPNIGFVLGLIPPAFIALLSGGVSTMIWVIVIYCVANFVIQTVLQPKFTGDAVGINATTAFLSLVFWALVVEILRRAAGWIVAVLALAAIMPVTAGSRSSSWSMESKTGSLSSCRSRS